jgi:putative MATE family efflux protein
MKKDNVNTKEFYSNLFALIMPIVFQNLMTAAASTADVMMLGYVSQASLSAVSLANQVQFILNLIFAGLTIGTTMLVSQYWGKGDKGSIEKILGIALRMSICVTAVFSISAYFFPKFLMLIFTSDRELIEIGASFLRIISIAYIFMSISQMYLCVMKSMERVKISVVISSSALLLNIFLNAVFIFGLFGVPKMGVVGVAIATTIAKAVELICCIVDSFYSKTIQLKASAIFENNPIFFKDFVHYSMPVLGNEIVWGVGFTMYSVILGHLGADVVAANSVANVVKNLATVVCYGIASGGSILLGNKLGKNDLKLAKDYASKLCKASFISGVVGGIMIILLRPVILNMVSLSETAYKYLNIMLFISAYYVIGKSVNATVISGIFCAGGDSRFGFICDAIDMWAFSIPLGFLCAFVFKLPVMVVYFIICLDEFVKMPFVYMHYKNYKWLKNITRDF